MNIVEFIQHHVFDIVWLSLLSGLFCYFWFDRRSVVRAKRWATTQGQVTHCEWGYLGHSLWPKITYVYQVDGNDFTSDRFFLEAAHRNVRSVYARQVAYRITKAYEQNEGILVYYNPQKPQCSVLDVGIPRKLNFILGYVVALMVLHLVVCFF